MNGHPCPLCKHPAVELTGGKVKDLESIRIVQVLSCGHCEFVEELDVVLHGKRLRVA